MSAKPGFPPHVVQLIWERDRQSCARCGRGLIWDRRGQDWAVHHRRPRGSGGTSIPWVNRAANGVLLCTGCHNSIEVNRFDATLTGFLVPRLGKLEACDVPIAHAFYGRAYLDDEGGVTPVYPPTSRQALAA